MHFDIATQPKLAYLTVWVDKTYKKKNSFDENKADWIIFLKKKRDNKE